MRPRPAVAIALAAAWLAATPASAKDKHDRHHRDDGGTVVNIDVHIGAPQRVIVRDYYVTEFRGGHCPPGLAKKHNGCLPPGQAKKLWRVGRPLPPQVVYYELPPPLVVQLGPPPRGYRYVRVADDVLLLGVGSGMVVDAIADLSRL